MLAALCQFLPTLRLPAFSLAVGCGNCVASHWHSGSNHRSSSGLPISAARYVYPFSDELRPCCHLCCFRSFPESEVPDLETRRLRYVSLWRDDRRSLSV